ncbi:uncharacterized protein LOC144025859 isoform X2 [Festucalex cinctus]
MRMALHLLLLLLMIPFGGCVDGLHLTTKTIAVGQDVTLECPTDQKQTSATILWIRLVSGTFPEYLFGTSAVKASAFIQTGTFESRHRITAKNEREMFVLQISQVQKSDMAVYYCLQVMQYKVTFLRGTFLQVKDNYINSAAATQNLRSDESPPGRSVSLRCSVLSPLWNKTCTDGHKVFWFRSETDQAPPSFIYAREDCKKVQKDSMQKCVYAFSKDISSSDAGTYACAVATCGEIFMGHATKDTIRCDSHQHVIYVLAAALALSFILLAFLIKKSLTESCFCCKACRQRQEEETSSRVQQSEEDSLVYSVPKIIARRSGKANPTKASVAEEFSTYTDVRLRN